MNDLFDSAGRPEVMLELVTSEFDEPDYIVSTWERLDNTRLPGSYELTARQGGVSVTRFVDIKAGDAGDPAARVITADDPLAWRLISPGDPLTAVLAGFAPNTTVPLALYRATDEYTDLGAIFEFVQPMPSAAIGEQGWAYYDFLAPDVEDTAGTWGYCLATVESLRLLYCQPYIDAFYSVGP
ncbi:hypothetical protein [Ilumatobacter sp.]|uniref:hypothetical protein n=1 Tax=Ilumatobacter sp. TaxID=1967498 RepID=UPI003AF94460